MLHRIARTVTAASTSHITADIYTPNPDKYLIKKEFCQICFNLDTDLAKTIYHWTACTTKKKGLPKEGVLWSNKHTEWAIPHNNPHSAGGELAYIAQAEGGKMVENECYRHSWSANVIMMAWPWVRKLTDHHLHMASRHACGPMSLKKEAEREKSAVV